MEGKSDHGIDDPTSESQAFRYVNYRNHGKRYTLRGEVTQGNPRIRCGPCLEDDQNLHRDIRGDARVMATHKIWGTCCVMPILVKE